MFLLLAVQLAAAHDSAAEHPHVSIEIQVGDGQHIVHAATTSDDVLRVSIEYTIYYDSGVTETVTLGTLGPNATTTLDPPALSLHEAASAQAHAFVTLVDGTTSVDSTALVVVPSDADKVVVEHGEVEVETIGHAVFSQEVD